MTMIEKLLSLADDLLARGTRSAVAKRRAVSTAYYAVFHAVARLCADELLGVSSRSTEDYLRVYRALDHGPLKSVFASVAIKENPRLREIGDRIVRLQSERHRSDYLPPGTLYSRGECAQLLEVARSAVQLLSELPSEARRTLAVSVLFKNRPS